MLAVMLLSQYRISSSRIVRPRAACGARCMGHAVKTWSAVCSEAPHSQFGEGARPHLCIEVVLLTQNIEDSFEAKKEAVAVFVNLTAAYDTVWHRGLTCKLMRLLPDKHMVVRMIMELV